MHQLSHKAIERIDVGRRHGKDYIGGDSLSFVASLDLWECCRPDKVCRDASNCPHLKWTCYAVDFPKFLKLCETNSNVRI
jgi:hypothetical protein